MSETMDGGSAFPAQPIYEKPNVPGALLKMRQGGMSLRDYFAGQALAGMLTRTDVLNRDDAIGAARDAYLVADAMLAARAARTGEAA